MSLQNVAQHLAAQGRRGDTELVHMTKDEVAHLRALAHQHGIEMPTNPHTGLPEASWWSKILSNPIVDTLAGAALDTFVPGLGDMVGLGLSDAATAGLLVGGASGLASGNLGQGIMSGLGAYGGASLMGGIANAGMQTNAANALTDASTKFNAGQLSQAELTSAQQAYTDAISKAATPTAANLSAGVSSAVSNPTSFLANNWKPALAAALPILQNIQSSSTTKLPTTTQSPQYITPYSYNPYTHGLTSLGDYQANTSGTGPGYTKLAEGGVAHYDDGGGTMSGPSLDAYRYLMGLSNSPTSGGLGALAQQGQFSNWQPQAAADAQSNSAGPGGGAGGSGGGTDLSVVDAGATDQNLGSDTSLDDNSYSGGVLQSLIGQNSPAPVEDAVPSVVNDPSVLESMTPPAPTELTPAGDGSQAPIEQLDTPPSAMNAASAAFVPPASTETPYTVSPDISSIIANSPVVQASNSAPAPAPADPINQAAVQTSQVLENQDNSTPYTASPDISSIIANSPVVQAASTPADNAPAPAAVPTPDTQVVNPYVPPVDSSLAGYNYAAGPFENGGFGPGDSYGGGDFYGGGGSGGCPAPWIKVTLADGGTVAAGDIKPGMKVFTQHEHTGVWGVHPVTAVGFGEDERWKVVTEDGREFIGTFNHRVKTDKDWVEIRHLQPGDKIVQINGHAVVKSSQHFDYGKIVKITVHDAHTYLTEGFLSHNMKYSGGADIGEYAHGGLSAGASHASALRGPLTSLHGVEHLMQYAHGGSTPYSDGQYNLGGYSDGGRLLRGPGDGVSDSIPATIANKQPARLADGEFVVPARIVSELGNGSTEAGARKLYAMMDRIQKARSKTVGKGRVAVNNKADKYLPA